MLYIKSIYKENCSKSKILFTIVLRAEDSLSLKDHLLSFPNVFFNFGYCIIIYLQVYITYTDVSILMLVHLYRLWCLSERTR